LNCAVLLGLPHGWREASANGRVPLRVFLEYDGARHPIGETPRDAVLGLTPRNDALLFVLEEMAGGEVPDALEVEIPDFLILLALHRGHSLWEEGGRELPVNAAVVSTVMRVDLDHENGELLLVAHTELPFMRGAEFPTYVVAGKAGWVFGGGHFWALDKLLPSPLWEIYRRQVVIPRKDVPRFLRDELPRLADLVRVEAEVEPDVFSFEPEVPQFRLEVRGSPASLAMRLVGVYGDVALSAAQSSARGAFAHPDPEDILRYTVRDIDAEQKALALLARFDVSGRHGGDLNDIVGTREVLNFLGRAVPFLRRRDGASNGTDGSAPRWMPRCTQPPWSASIRGPATTAGSRYALTTTMAKAAAFPPPTSSAPCAKAMPISSTRAVTFCWMPKRFAPSKACLATAPRARGAVPAVSGWPRLRGLRRQRSAGSRRRGHRSPAAWIQTAARHNRIESVEAESLDPSLDRLLRPYQKDGIRWLRFLQRNRFGGILADEMGLGKTLQTLVWLSMAGVERSGDSRKPSLIVCPTSLVENWAAEAARFTPWLKIGTMTGADRHSRWKDLHHLDVVVTSYALMRRDIESL
jgi:hypothetical protein